MQQIKLIFLISLALLAVHGVSADDDLIRSTCRRTPDWRICESSLRSDPRSISADTTGLILIIIDVAESKFSDSLSYISKIMKESPPPEMKKALTVCKRTLNVVIDQNIRVAKDAVPGDPKFGVDAMRDSATEADICSDDVNGVQSGASYKSVLIERMRFLIGLSNVAASMITVLE